MSARIAFFGAGVMGGGMVRRLLANGHDVAVWERDRGKHAGLVALGAHTHSNLAELVHGREIVIGCLLNTTVTREVYLGNGGVIASVSPGTIIVEHGTFDPSLAQELERCARVRGASFFDAPVTGGPERAADGSLVAMVGGDHAALDRCIRVLECYCSDVVRVGGSGSGQRLKLINQFLVSIHAVAAAEASALVLRSGIDPSVALRVLMGGWAASTMLGREMPRACASDFANSGATVGKLTEVQPMIGRLLHQTGAHSSLFPVAQRAFDEAIHSGAADLDLSAIVTQYLRDDAIGRSDS